MNYYKQFLFLEGVKNKIVHIAIRQTVLTTVLGWADKTGLPHTAEACNACGNKRCPKKAKLVVNKPCSNREP